MYLTQQALSRQIKELEDELGLQLFERTTRRVALTPAGEAFYEQTKMVIAQFDDAVALARRTKRALSGRLRLGFCPGAALELTAYILDAFREASPEVEIEMREFPANDPSAGLASGVVDVAFIRLPQGTQRIETEDLFVDPVVAMLTDRHPLASRGSLSADDLLGEQLTLSDTTDEEYKAFWSLAGARTADTPLKHRPVSSVTEEAALVVAGAAVSVTSSAVEFYAPMPGARYVRLDDWPGSRVVVGWHAGERSPLVARFVDAACSVRDAQTDLIARMENREPRNREVPTF